MKTQKQLPAKKFFKDATISFTESSRRKGGYYSYSDVNHTGCLMIAVGKETIEFVVNSVGRIDFYSKRSKTLKYTGQEITEKKYANQLAKWIATVEALHLEKAKKAAKAANEANCKREERIEDAKMHILVKVAILADVFREITATSTSAEVNQIQNKAVGIVGYRFAKEIGWTNVLQLIQEEVTV